MFNNFKNLGRGQKESNPPANAENQYQQVPGNPSPSNQEMHSPEVPNRNDESFRATEDQNGGEKKKTFVGNIKNGIGNVMNKVTSNIPQNVTEGINALKTKKDTIKEELLKNVDELKSDLKKNLDDKVRDAIQKRREMINAWIRKKIEMMILNLLKRAHPVIKDALKDPGMYGFVEEIIDDLVDEIWPDIEEEVLYRLRLATDQPIVEVPTKEYSCLILCPWYCFRNWVMYYSYPIDLNIYQQTRTFSWWIILLLSLIPVYGGQTYFFCLLFLMIDKSDEYQLVQFILSFKRLQFFTNGLLNGMIGYIQYYVCSTNIKYNALNIAEYGKCMIEGPGSQINYFLDVIAEILKIALVWLCFLMLPYSKAKGRPKFRYAKLADPTARHDEQCLCCTLNIQRGGRLKGFMIYDIVTFIICVAGFFVITFVQDAKEEFQLKTTIFAMKMLYGILSFPFLIFLVPLLDQLLTRSRPTAYTRDGHCIPKIDLDKVKIIESDVESQAIINKNLDIAEPVSYTHLTLPTIYSV
eukprot:TRINITY_DN12990_c0_g1_i1.p1 TRINITY_DN12990_c0_g1~~TRINITY_DN12990_c0_g1_i1.p1  ORF type:complete len:524 (-),score=100.14 TRINITY_DN12990_c0_g1_i1:34-1605(-)